jgi:hypothetical protein
MDTKIAHLETIRKKLRNLVILDLDNTCICAVELKDVKHVPFGSAFRSVKLENLYRIYERPGLQPFLDMLFKEYDVAIWTAAGFEYAMFIIRHFIQLKHKNRPIQFVLWDTHCDYSTNHSKEQAKDLSLLPPMYKRFVLMDDNPDVLNQDHVLDSEDFDVMNPDAKDDVFFQKAPGLLKNYFDTHS